MNFLYDSQHRCTIISLLYADPNTSLSKLDDQDKLSDTLYG